MNNDLKSFFKIMGGFAFGVLLTMAYQYDNPQEYTVDWRDVGKIVSTKSNKPFYTITTTKGDFGSIDFDAEKKLKNFTAGKTLYKLYVVKELKWPGMKTKDIGEIQEQYACKGCGYILDGGTIVTGSIKW